MKPFAVGWYAISIPRIELGIGLSKCEEQQAANQAFRNCIFYFLNLAFAEAFDFE